MAAIEVALIFALRIGKQRDVTWPITLMAVLAALFLALGVLRHYLDIYLHRTVRGVSFIFCGIDALGDLTSLLSIFFQRNLDVLGIVIYGVELALWIGIFACGAYFNLLPWLKLQHSSATTNDIDSTIDAPRNNPGTIPDIALHDLTSSNSAFRTSSASVNTVRSRPRRSSLQSTQARNT